MSVVQLRKDSEVRDLLTQIKATARMLEEMLREGRELPGETLILNLQFIVDVANRAEDWDDDGTGEKILPMLFHIQGLSKLMIVAADAKIEIGSGTIIDNLALIGDLATWAGELLG